MLLPYEKRILTRFITLNQPCQLSHVIREVCGSIHGPMLSLSDVFQYICDMNTQGHVGLDPDIFNFDYKDKREFTKQNSLADILDGRLEILIFIPDFYVEVWIKYWRKRLLTKP